MKEGREIIYLNRMINQIMHHLKNIKNRDEIDLNILSIKTILNDIDNLIVELQDVKRKDLIKNE